jgi:hypothetical protein
MSRSNVKRIFLYYFPSGQERPRPFDLCSSFTAEGDRGLEVEQTGLGCRISSYLLAITARQMKSIWGGAD